MSIVRKLPNPWTDSRVLGPMDYGISRIPQAYTSSTLMKTPEGPWLHDLTSWALNAQRNRVIGKSVVLWGAHGRGKTSAAVALLKGMMSRGQSGLFVRYDQLMSTSRMRVVYDKDMTLDEKSLEVDVLLIDDLFNGFDADPERYTRCLQQIIRTRHDKLAVTLMTTNVATEKWGKFMSPALETLVVNNWSVISMDEAPNERQRLSREIYKRRT